MTNADPDVAQVRAAIARVKKAKAGLRIALLPGTLANSNDRCAAYGDVDRAAEYLAALCPTLERLLDKWEPVTVTCEICGGSGRTHGKVLVSRCERCAGTGVTNAVA